MMDGRLPNLKAGLANISNDILRARTDKLMAALQAAADAYHDDNSKSAMMALDAVTTFLRDERLEAPFRFLVDVLDESRRKGATKPLDQAREEALLVAKVDAVMAKGEESGRRCSLEDACKAVAKQAAWAGTIKDLRGNRKEGKAQPDWKIIRSLRDNIKHGKARPEATEVYRYHLDNLHRDWSPNEDLPAPLAGSTKANRKRERKP